MTCYCNYIFLFSSKFEKAGKGRKIKKKNFRDANKKIRNCIDEMGEKLKIAIQQDIYFTKVSGIEELSWKFIDCLVEDEVKTLKQLCLARRCSINFFVPSVEI